MTTQSQMQREKTNVYQFLQTKANSRGLVTINQEVLASEFGMGAPKFHRLLHKLEADGKLRIAGGGRQPKTIWLIPPDRQPEASSERTEKALMLFDALQMALSAPNA